MTAKPQNASTVMLLRDRAASPGFEALMVFRNRRSAFAPGVYVFPGGAVDAGDCEPAVTPFISGLSGDEAFRILDDCRSPADALGSWVAAAREVFEETGILVARDRSGEIVESFPPEALRNLWNDRLKIRTKECAFREFLAREGLTVAADRLHYFSHWITPEILPIRFDVRFFAAKAPRGQEALHDGAETTKSLWISPANALRRHDEGSFPMVLPTVVVLEELAEFRSVDEVVESTAGKSICGILTRIVVDDRDGVVEYFPDGTARRRCHPSMDLRTMPGYERSVVVAKSRETES